MLSADPESRPPMHAVSHTFAQLAAAAGGSTRNISEPGLPPAQPSERQGAGAATRSETVAPAAGTAAAQDQPPMTTGGSAPKDTVAAGGTAGAQEQPTTIGSCPPSATIATAAGTAAAQ